MESYFTRVCDEILVAAGELENYLLYPTDGGRFVCVNKKEGHLVADVRRFSIMRARMESEYKELQVIIEHMNVKQGGLLATMERKQKLMSGVGSA